jgi:hypothetical protein
MNKSPFEVKNEKVAFNDEMNKNDIQENNINSEISLNKGKDKEMFSNYSKER